jgi:hypothetical protein
MVTACVMIDVTIHTGHDLLRCLPNEREIAFDANLAQDEQSGDE